MPHKTLTKVNYRVDRVKRLSLPGHEQGHLRIAKKQRTENLNVFIKIETLNQESEDEDAGRSVGEFHYIAI
jgi:hypothetical protein